MPNDVIQSAALYRPSLDRPHTPEAGKQCGVPLPGRGLAATGATAIAPPWWQRRLWCTVAER
jgi:hypothetical protein